MSIKLVILLISILWVVNLSTAATQPAANCQTSCGNLTNITFPFGTSPECYLNDHFFINCSTTTNTAFLRRGNIEVLNISLDGEMRVSAFVARTCYNESGLRINSSVITSEFTLSSFSVSSTRNRLTVVGCATLSLVQGYSVERNYTTGCAALCDGTTSVVNGSCSGIGCCQASIPEGVGDFTVGVRSLGNYSRVVGFNPCSYGFVAETGEYEFSSEDLRDFQGRTNMPVVLDWTVGDLNCSEAKKNESSYACRDNSECFDSTSTGGYTCNCTSGFQGNPYLSNGCQDINECNTSNRCGNGYECINLAGNYTCLCPKSHEDDGTSCRKKDAKRYPLLDISLGISSGLLLLLLVSTWIFWLLRKRKIMKQREQFFDQNGGFILKQQLSKHQGSTQTAKIFTAEDLKKATNNYDEARVIGQGGFGTVYKGMLSNNLEVAIKKSKITDKSQVEQFINEVVILSQINHRNVVKLLGCCLETEVPLLVYEFIKNGTLSDHIHDKIRALSLSWEMRMKIAVEAAGALAYLHSETSTPIIHRDIKSTNILLDENYTTKVSDFGASRLIPLDQSQLATLVQGTFGYMDPEYFHSSQLTEKSDVYSFGVLLAELMTGEAVISFDREEKHRNLAMYFVSSVKEDRLHEILDDRLMKEVNFDHLNEVAMLVKMCLRVKGEERPTMREVSMELEGILRMITKHPWVEKDLDSEESKNLLSEVEPLEGYNGNCTTTVYDSMRDQIIVPFDQLR